MNTYEIELVELGITCRLHAINNASFYLSKLYADLDRLDEELEALKIIYLCTTGKSYKPD